MRSTTGINATLADSPSEPVDAAQLDSVDVTDTGATTGAVTSRQSRLARIVAALRPTRQSLSGRPEAADDSDDEARDTDREEPLPETADTADAGDAADTSGSDDTEASRRRPGLLVRILAYGALPGAALLLAGVAGYLKFVDASARDAEVARIQSVQAAIESTVVMLSYRPDTVTQNLAAALDRMTGGFRDSYAALTHDVVIPGAQQRQISAVATVPAAASVSATQTHAEVLLYVNQATTIGNDPPTDSASRVKVTLEKVNDRWLISQFDPI